MHPEEIKAAIRMKGYTATDVARSLGVSHACVSHVIHGHGVSARVARRICEITGIPTQRMWPDKRYPQIS